MSKAMQWCEWYSDECEQCCANSPISYFVCGVDDLMRLPASDHSRALIKDFQAAYNERWVSKWVGKAWEMKGVIWLDVCFIAYYFVAVRAVESSRAWWSHWPRLRVLYLLWQPFWHSWKVLFVWPPQYSSECFSMICKMKTPLRRTFFCWLLCLVYWTFVRLLLIM
jgi:hypothetical protein